MSTTSPSPDPARRQARAYDAGARMARERIAREAPLDGEALATVEAADIVVTSGVYDRVEQVLGALQMPFTAIAPSQLAAVELRPDQLLVVNCPGHIGAAGVDRVRAFVEAGGSLFATDWALQNVVQHAFPGTVEHGGRDTRDDVVPIEIANHDNPFLRGVMDGADEPVWWLEGSSHPIRVLDPGRVEVLIRSAELGARYGEPAVAVLFRWGTGEVFHMISHYYLQRTELRSRRQARSGAAYYAEKGVAVPADMAGDLAALNLGEVEAAASSARLFANVVAQKKRAAQEQARRRVGDRR